MADQEPQVANEAAQAPVFAVVPAAAVDGPLDYTTRHGLTVYERNVRPVFDDETRYDVDSSGLQGFLRALARRSRTAQWDLDVPIDIDDDTIENGPYIHLIDHHGEAAIDMVSDWAATFVNTESRDAQNNIQMIEAIMASLSEKGKSKLLPYESEWMVTVGNLKVPSGHMLVKIVIRTATIDTNATTRILREKLSSLPEHLEECGYDITLLNAFVINTIDQLNARGETTTDLLSNLFKGYMSAGDEVFVKYIEEKQSRYDEGQDLTHTQLMNLASNKYKLLVEKKKWRIMSEQDKKILALETKLEEYKKSFKASKTAQKKDTSNSNSNSGKTNNNKSKGGKKSGKSNKPKKELPAWVYQHPGQEFIDQNRSKTVDGKTYWWCIYHKRFTQHKSSECRLNPANQSSGNSSGGQSAQQTLRVSNALQTILQEE